MDKQYDKNLFGNGFIIGVNAYQSTNANNVIKCAIQSGKHLRFQGDSNVGGTVVNYEYFIIKAVYL